MKGLATVLVKRTFFSFFLVRIFFPFQIFFDISRDVFFFFNLRLFVQVEGSGAADGEEKHLSVSWPPGRPVGGGLRLHKSDFAE